MTSPASFSKNLVKIEISQEDADELLRILRDVRAIKLREVDVVYEKTREAYLEAQRQDVRQVKSVELEKPTATPKPLEQPPLQQPPEGFGEPWRKSAYPDVIAYAPMDHPDMHDLLIAIENAAWKKLHKDGIIYELTGNRRWIQARKEAERKPEKLSETASALVAEVLSDQEEDTHR